MTGMNCREAVNFAKGFSLQTPLLSSDAPSDFNATGIVEYINRYTVLIYRHVEYMLENVRFFHNFTSHLDSIFVHMII